MRKIVFWIMMVLLIGCSVLIGYSLKKCDCEEKINVEKTEEEIRKEKYEELNDKLFEYLNDIYNNDKWVNDNIISGVYSLTLSEIKDMGYDISMFVNPVTEKQCDLEMTYGKFIIGISDEGKTSYTFDTKVSCEDE